jgi:indolepyruvate ferredoxin oxidoreductase beta subunit
VDKVTNILIVGVGGQGTLLASKVIGRWAMNAGYDVKVSEVHGMSQRGGSVVTYVRFGPKVFSPLIEKGQADMVLAFEKLEALRWAPYLNEDGIVIANTQEIMPMPVIIGADEYPPDIMERLNTMCKRVLAIDALDMAMQAGNSKAANIVLIGAMAKMMDGDKQSWLDVITQVVPPRTVEINQKAFLKGYETA